MKFYVNVEDVETVVIEATEEGIQNFIKLLELIRDTDISFTELIGYIKGKHK